MIISASQQIAAPREFVFARAVEFERLVRAAEGRGAEVDPPRKEGEALRYGMRYPFRDELWPVELVLEAMVPPEGLDLRIEGKVAMADATVRFAEAGADTTAVALRAELKPLGLQGRVLIGSLHVLRSRVQERIDRDLAALARGAEALWRNARV